jgi:hypothetical protein
MAIVVKDRVKQSASAPGTGTITLGAVATGFQGFSAIGNGNVTYFAIVDAASGAWEVNYGTYTSSGTTLSRNATPLSSSNAGALVNFTGTVDVFCTYPASKSIYEETTGNVLIDGGPITVVGSGVTTYTTFGAALAELYANINSFAQFYAQNLSGGSSASTDIVAYNNLGDGTFNFVDMGITSSNYTEAAFPIFTPGSAYLYNDGGELLVGTATATKDLLLFAGGVATTDWAARISGTNQSILTKAGLAVGGTLGVTGAASFSSTVALSANPTTALQAATKQYVDNQVTAGLHIHEPVRVETTGNLTATYAQGGTTFNITDITSGTTVTTSANHGLNVNDQIWLYTSAGNGLSTNTAYFVFSAPALNQLTLSLTFDGTQVTGLTNASGLTYATRANSGVGATLTNAGAQAALQIDSVNLATTNRVMVRLQTNGAENGVYTVTTVGDGSSNWVLTRATDSNQVNPASPDGLGTGDYYFTREGTLNAGDSHVLTTEPNTMIIGYTTLTYTQFSGGVVYTGTAPINVTGQVISLTGTVAATNGGTGASTVTTGDLLYGSATNTWSKLPKGTAYRSLIMDASATNVEWNAVALNQSNAVSGTLATTNGGTGLSSYVLGDTIYSSAANTLIALPGNTTTTKKFLVQTGTGSVSAAPAWDVVNGADVNGNITGSAGSVANALTAGTYLTSAGTFNGAAARTFAVDATDANTASKVVARDASGNFSAGTITATLSGNATNVSGTVAFANGGTGETTRQAAMDALAGAVTSGQYLRGNGSDVVMSAIQVADVPTLNQNTTGNATTATTATNLAGGSAGTVPYQSAAGTTAMLAVGSSGQVLQSNGASAPSWITVPNGTLTMAVSGTGLSGSATFTANQAGASTFTVTSNATNANTASAIVARDASGNFSAGTITATLSGNASTATSATNASNVKGGSFSGVLILTDAAYFRGAPTAGVRFNNNADTFNNLIIADNGNVTIRGTAATAAVTATGNITAFFSDDRLKTRLGNIEDALAKIKTLDTFYYEANETAQALGYKPIRDVAVSAQQVQAIMPETVAPAPIDDKYLTVRYERLVPLLIAAIKELEAKVAALEAKG